MFAGGEGRIAGALERSHAQIARDAELMIELAPGQEPLVPPEVDVLCLVVAARGTTSRIPIKSAVEQRAHVACAGLRTRGVVVEAIRRSN